MWKLGHVPKVLRHPLIMMGYCVAIHYVVAVGCLLSIAQVSKYAWKTHVYSILAIKKKRKNVHMKLTHSQHKVATTMDSSH